MRKRILICAANYLPGYKSGGPIRSVVNLITHLGSSLDFYVITRDRDAGDDRPYEGITPGEWHEVGKARVLYCSRVSPGVLRKAFQEVRPDLIHLGSFQDTFTIFAVLLRRIGAFGDTPVVLAPRGEFSAGAMAIKRTKKRIYRYSAKMLGLHEGLLWQAMGPREKQEILEAAPARRLDPDSIFVARSITEQPVFSASHLDKQAGTVKLAFISRVSEKKNLHYVLELLRQIRGRIEFNIYGPVTEKDAAYWEKCRALLNNLPENIEVQYHGSVEPSAVLQVLHEHHFFVLPTRGENYCHAAVESFLNGTPVILSDETPWTGLRQTYSGFDIPLNDSDEWVAVLQQCVDMDQSIYNSFLEGAKEYSSRFSIEEAVGQHLAMFESAFAARPDRLRQR
ncbi:MAG: glycosyltransferase family 4 protein [Terracidiphilus sp.]